MGSGEQQVDEPVADGPRLADVQQLASLPRGGGIARGAARGEDEVSPERLRAGRTGVGQRRCRGLPTIRSEEHTSELQSRVDLVCRLLLEKKKKRQNQ